MKTKKAIFLLTILLLIGSYELWKSNKDFLLLWNSNTINVTTEKPLNKEKVKIEYGFNSISRKSDKEMFMARKSKTILYDGERKAKLENEYGENDFLVIYDNKYYLSFRQFKFNRRHQHSYNFYLTNKNNKMILQTEIKGQNGMKFEREMIEVEKADKYLCNEPIDSAGTIYNMLELKNK
jgi:hypothetical protein